MDFTDAYRLTTTAAGSHRTFAYSPGSTFIATLHHLTDSGGTVVQVRVSTSLQVIRTWTLDFVASSLTWSRSGGLLLIAGRGQFTVLAVEPRRGEHSASSLQGVVASVKAGFEGMASVSWIGNAHHESVCVFSADEILANIYDIHTGSVVSISNPKRSRLACSSYHAALLTRQAAKDGIVILASPHPRLSLQWQIEEHFTLQTNDAVELAWSPDEKYLAVREGILEYRVHIYSPLGHLQSSFEVDSDPTSTYSTFVSTCANPSGGSSSNVSGGGLGVREMKWNPNGRLLALGGTDEKVWILESSEWGLAACLDLSQKTVAEVHEGETSAMGVLMAWREPFDWREETGGRGIVTYEKMDMPFTVASLRTASPSKAGISSLQWNHDGSLLAVRNDNHPALIYIFAFPPVAVEEADQRIRPYLLSVVTFSSSVTVAAWKPVSEREPVSSKSCLAVLTSHSQSVHLWTYRACPCASQIVEAIPIPIDDFQAIDFAYAPDGNKMLITSQNDTYCCAIEAGEEGQEDGDLYEASRL